MSRKQVVIVGGGFGGLQVAQALEHVDVDVTLVDRENHHLFQPLLYQVATAGLSPGTIAVPIRSVLRKQKNVQVLLGEVSGVDLEGKAAVLRDGTRLPYDWLVLAVGVRTNYFGHDAWAQYAHGMKTLRDAIRIRERVLLSFEAAEREEDPARRATLLTFVCIGGGPTGVEMAGAISELGRMVLAGDYRRIKPEDIRVVLVEMTDRVLSPFDRSLSESAADQLRELGVELRLGEAVTDVSAEGVTVGEERIPASVVVWATGVKPVSLAARSGLTLDGRGLIRVDGSCAALGHPEVFAIGDVAAFVPEGEERPLPMLAPVAIQQGRFVARQIARELRRRPRERFEYFDKGIMATVGRSRAVAQTGKLRLTGFLAWLAWGFIHILYIIGFHNRAVVLFEWVWSYLTFKRGARLITAHVGADAGPPALVIELDDPYRTALAQAGEIENAGGRAGGRDESLPPPGG